MSDEIGQGLESLKVLCLKMRDDLIAVTDSSSEEINGSKFYVKGQCGNRK